MSTVKALEHPKAPHNQPFNVGARHNLTKKRSWWNAGSDSFWRTRSKPKKEKKEEVVDE